MFSLFQVKSFDYRHPWNATCAERVRTLYRRENRVVYVYPHRDNSTFRYRVFNMTEAINSDPASTISSTWFYYDELKEVLRVLPDCTTVVLCRLRYSPSLLQLVRLARLHGVRVLFDVDDLVFSTEKLPTLLDTIGHYDDDEGNLDHWYAYTSRIGEMARLCDGVILTNPFLAERLQETFPGKPTYVIPNFLNRVQQQFSDEIFAAKKASGFESVKPVAVGYFSGSPSHRRDFDLAIPAIANALKRNRNMRLVLVGYIQPGAYLEPYQSQIDYYPMQDHVNLQRLIGSVEVNVVPLVENEFTNCKSELKYFEAAMVGTLTVASPSYTYSRSIEDGVTGFLAKPDQWEEKLDRAIALVGTDDYVTIAHRARDSVARRYGWDQHVGVIAEVLLQQPRQA